MAFLTARVLDRLVGAIERATFLDRVAEPLAAVLSPVLRRKGITEIVSGTPVGHALHPALVATPIGAFAAAGYLDLLGDRVDPTAARRLTGLGVVAAVPAQITGASDWLDTMGAERRVGMVHAAANNAAILCYAGSWLARRRGNRGAGLALAAVGGSVLGLAGWLGGHLAYAMGVGVDTTAFQHHLDDWTDAAAVDDLQPDVPYAAEVDGVAVLLLLRGDRDGAITALADRCTHRGGPLHEGELDDGCVVCPWHGSRFALDGSVQCGPATRPQPHYEVRVQTGRVQVRRPTEHRTLRTNPVRSA